MQALDYLLPQPPFELNPGKMAEFDVLIDSTPAGSFIEYGLSSAKWQFLSYLCQSRDLVLHGSQNMEIVEVEPRKAGDVRLFSMQNAIYATTDGIWAIFFAIVDRRNFQPLTLFNSCLDLRLPPDTYMGPLYFFSITHSALVKTPWCDGVVYILPRGTFEQEPVQYMLGAEIISPHWISPNPVRPRARLKVQPQDFPFLADIHGHDDEILSRLVEINPDGYPWPEALIT
jgi:hypothetical protein